MYTWFSKYRIDLFQKYKDDISIRIPNEFEDYDLTCCHTELHSIEEYDGYVTATM